MSLISLHKYVWSDAEAPGDVLRKSKMLTVKARAQASESACEKEDGLMHLYLNPSIHICVCLAFCEIDDGLFRSDAGPPSLR